MKAILLPVLGAAAPVETLIDQAVDMVALGVSVGVGALAVFAAWLVFSTVKSFFSAAAPAGVSEPPAKRVRDMGDGTFHYSGRMGGAFVTVKDGKVVHRERYHWSQPTLPAGPDRFTDVNGIR